MKDFQQTQLDFIQHLKNPGVNDFNYGVEDRRLAVYRELFFNNIKGFLSSGFPVLESLYTESQWQDLSRRFFAEHDCRSPYFVDISKEFVEYLSNAYQLQDHDPEFMPELAHYEWIELAVSIRKQTKPLSFWDGLSNYQSVELSELAELVSYHYPVHQISPDNRSGRLEQPIYFVVCRNQNDEVDFTLINAATAYLLDILQQQPQTLSELTRVLAQAMPQLTLQQVSDSAKQIVEQMLRQQILVLGND